MRKLPREAWIRFVPNIRGGTHNVLEVCGKEDNGVRYVMTQDYETAKDRDKYKVRAHLQEERIAALEEQVRRLENHLRKRGITSGGTITGAMRPGSRKPYRSGE